LAKRRKTGGRRAGTPNKFTTELRTAVLKAFDRLGGYAYLVRVGNENSAAFCAMLSKLLPHELATSGGALKHEVVLRWMTPEMAKARGLTQTALDDA
jgi:hypothetical protein